MNVTRSILFPLIAVAVAIASAPSAVAQNAARAALLDFEIVAPRLLRQDGQTTLTIEGYGRAWRLELRPNGGLLESLSPQARAQVRKNRNRFYIGQVAGAPGSWARVNRVAGQLTAMFFDGRTLFMVERAGAFELAAKR